MAKSHLGEKYVQEQRWNQQLQITCHESPEATCYPESRFQMYEMLSQMPPQLTVKRKLVNHNKLQAGKMSCKPRKKIVMYYCCISISNTAR